MSKHDTQFFNHFSMVIGILVTIAILLIALSKVVGADNQLQHLKTEALQLAAVDEGIGGAPRIGDRAAWAPRIAKGKDTLYKHSIEGFQGEAGVMPPKGGFLHLPDDLIRQGVDYMVERSR